MTKIIYNVINRPKKDSTGRTNIGWLAECGRPEVHLGGYMTTSRTAKGQDRSYLATLIKDDAEKNIDGTFKSRAQASFAIWRAYHDDWRGERAYDRMIKEAMVDNKRVDRAKVKAFRQTPEGAKAYRADLNAKAQARRASMTDLEKAAVTAKRIAKKLRNTVSDI